jgi:predicted secreted protein with PEFG-CTERM motif
VTGSSAASYNLNVEGDTYPIEYEATSGSISNMFVRPAEDKLVVTLDAEEDGQLTLVLPREVIDAVESGQDISYIVTIEDESGNISSVEVEESENTDDARTLVIDYDAGTARIEIQGTQVVPEFGAVAAIVMAIAIVGIIVATARHGKFSLFRQ